MSMLAGRLAGLTATALLLIATLGALSDKMQPSARLVLVTAVFGALAPLFWPGRASTRRQTTFRIAAWSLAATALAAAVAALGNGATALAARIAVVCGVLLLVLLVATALTAGLEALLRRRTSGPDGARETAAWLATAALVTLGASPLWLGPAAELASRERPGVIDMVVAVSPLTHLAVASGNDLLRNQWFYQHSNLSGLRFDYPRLRAVIAVYVVLAAALLVIPAVLPTRWGPKPRTGLSPSTKEQRP